MSSTLHYFDLKQFNMDIYGFTILYFIPAKKPSKTLLTQRIF